MMSAQQGHLTPSSAMSTPLSRPVSPFPTDIDSKATASYIRRTLCAHHAISAGPPRSVHDLLPPLTSSNEVDLQLYAIIGVILKEFVQAWYGKITPDHAFVDEVLLVIAHCTRGLEERLRATDLEGLLFDELPRLMQEHVTDYRLSHRNASQNLGRLPSTIYHSLHPHPALEPVPVATDGESAVEQEKNEQAWRHILVQGVLSIVLPTEDLQSGCLRSLVEEVMAEMILGNVISNRMCQPWVLWELITNIIRSSQGRDPQLVSRHIRRKDEGSGDIDDPGRSAKSRLADFGLLSNPVGEEDKFAGTLSVAPPRNHSLAIGAYFWKFIGYAVLAFTMGRALLVLLMSLSKLPLRSKPLDAQGFKARPVLDMSIWSVAANVVELPTRMPWLSGMACLAQSAALSGPGRVARLDGKLDRLLSNIIATRILDPAHIPAVLRSLRCTFFPANTFPRHRKSLPDEAAITVVKQQCTEAILGAIPSAVRATYMSTGDPEVQVAIVESWLDVLSDPYLNKHLIFGLLELCIVRLMPELSSQGPTELLAQRIGLEMAS